MAVDAVNSSTPALRSTLTDIPPTDAISPTTHSTKKIDPTAKGNIECSVDVFISSMISNMLTMNNSLFNYAKEAMAGSDDG
ncbi:hypothetical protein T190_12075 [Sinorhizobium meliloti CCBAU 01290]|nr:hypothetical protein T190_12075 [Sinorhizobium meliloti CCBAU 01290]